MRTKDCELDTKKKLVKYWFEKGKTRYEIADELDICYQSVCDYLKEFGLEKRRAEPLSDEENMKIADMFLSGKTRTEIAKELGIHYSTVTLALNKRGINLNKPVEREIVAKDPLADEIAALPHNTRKPQSYLWTDPSTGKTYRDVTEFFGF